jgi:hypothetical protein
MLALLLLVNIALISWSVASLPVRAFLAFGFLVAVIQLYPDVASRALVRHRPVLALAAALAALGIFVSLANGTGFETIFRAVLEVHVQIAVTLIFATIVCEVAGARASAMVIVCCVGLTALVAMLQFANVDVAWHLREILGVFQGQALNEDGSFVHGRPMGLSYSPIHLATQLCLAFGAYVAVEATQRTDYSRRSAAADPRVIAAVILLIAASVVSGTRSPIVGAVIFLMLYAARRQSAWLLVLLLIGAALVYFVGAQLLESFQSAQPRLVRVDDDSAIGRLALWKFGLLLFRDNPLGYGFGFTPSEHWMSYWRDVYTMQGADDIKTKQLHNYIINLINTYGVGLILVMPLVVSLLRSVRSHLIYFVPYAAHIMFHNSGPFWNDTLIWFVIGAISATKLAPRSQDEHSVAGRVPRTGNLQLP